MIDSNLSQCNTKKIDLKDLEYNKNDTEKIFKFLNKYLSMKIHDLIVFDYTDKIKLHNKNNSINYVIFGKLLCFDIKKEKIYLYNQKTYKPYYNEKKLIGTYNFNKLGFDRPLYALIIKYLFYINKNQQKTDGVNDFPLFVISKLGYDIEISKILNINLKEYSDEKYMIILSKYKILLIDFFKTLNLEDNYYKNLYKNSLKIN